MSSRKRKEKARLQSFWYRIYRFFFPADMKASVQKGQMMGMTWKINREMEMKRGMEITGQRATWLQKIPFIGGLFKRENVVSMGEKGEKTGKGKV